MEVVSALRRHCAPLGGTLALLWSITPLSVSAGEVFNAAVKERLEGTGATSICDLDLVKNEGREILVYGNVVTTRASNTLMSDPRCPAVVIGVEFEYDGRSQRLRPFIAAAQGDLRRGLAYCACRGMLRPTSVSQRYYLDLDLERSEALDEIPREDAPIYPAKIVLWDGSIVPGPEFLTPRARPLPKPGQPRPTIPPLPW